jgi:hypothetical protein
MGEDDDRAEEIAEAILGSIRLTRAGRSARGVLVLTKELAFLEGALAEADFHVLVAPDDVGDFDAKTALLAMRILVTTGPAAFLDDAPVLDYGVISLEALPALDQAPDLADNTTARMISTAITDLDLLAEPGGFLVELLPEAEHRLQRLR